MANVDTLSIGGAIKRLLASSELKQKTLAEEAGVTSASLSRMLADAGGSPSVNRTLSTLKPLGFTLAVVKNGEPLPEGSILLRETKKAKDKHGRDTEHASGKQASE